MLFSSFPFLVLLCATFFTYYFLSPPKFQVPVLIISSLIFYAYHQPVLVLLLLLSVSINIISSYKIVYGKSQFKKFWATAGVVLNLSILVFFKYAGLIYSTFGYEGSQFGEFILNLPLPIGISFFTFQGISLVVDVYTNKYIKNTSIVPRSFSNHAERILFFKGFFPQLISGPIVKAHDFLPQISVKYFNNIQWETVFRHLLIGYFLKKVVADNLGNFTFWMTYPYFINTPALKLFAMLIGFSCQIFADFAGYSSIAIGLAKLFGYNFPENFNFPYISVSFRDFWKRWNISLSSFLMEYLYIPLGGNRKGKYRTYLNLMTVMVLGGLWHGAAWSYAVWGCMHGLALVAERMIGIGQGTRTYLAVFLKRSLVFSYVTFAWLLFKLPDFNYVIAYLQALWHNRTLSLDPAVAYIILYSSPVLLYHLYYLNRNRPWVTLLRKYNYCGYALMAFLIILNSGPEHPFIYFQF